MARTPFDTSSATGDLTFREIPIEVEASDLRFAGRGYDPAAVQKDINAQVPVERLLEFEQNGIIGQLNPVFWSFSGFHSRCGDACRRARSEVGPARQAL